MAARGYEFYFLMLKVSLTGKRSERVRDVLYVSMYYEMHVSGHMHSCKI